MAPQAVRKCNQLLTRRKVVEKLKNWLLYNKPSVRRGGFKGPYGHVACGRHPWWQIMCLSGVDYFSTLAYQPAIAVAAAGAVAPVATFFLVLVTLFCALPIYRRVARESPLGSGSVAMLERLIPWWGGKLLVLILLGFIATDFIITITLSASDAGEHAVHSPYIPFFRDINPLVIPIILISLLGGVFLLGFNEVTHVAVVCVFVFLGLNAILISVAMTHLEPSSFSDWGSKLLAGAGGDPFMVIVAALILFPSLALGLSGFETGVTVMPHIRNSRQKNTCNGCVKCGQVPNYSERIKGARRLLAAAALIMSTFLVFSNLVVTLLIPSREFEDGGMASGRALAYLSEKYLGSDFATVYDMSTIAILWFAGASAMAGMLNIIPRYLTRYGMAPAWIKHAKPLIIVITAISLSVLIAFDANVHKQGAAYATGVMVLITSASVAVTLSALRKKQKFAATGLAVVSIVFIYTTILIITERPNGMQIAMTFILGTILISILSRLVRSFNIRATSITFNDSAKAFVSQDADDYGVIHILAKKPDKPITKSEYHNRVQDETLHNRLLPGSPVIFIEVLQSDSSDFEEDLIVEGKIVGGHRVLRTSSCNIPSAIAAILLEIRDITGVTPDVYFHWTERNPVMNTLRYLITGGGEIAAITREVLREAERNSECRPVVHVS
nr:amino acid transporter [Tropheryma whipplei]